MSPLALILVLGQHQPPGTPDEALQDALRKLYGPLLAALLRNEDIKVSLHLSGPLLRRVSELQPNYIDILKSLVQRGQVELIGGGWGWAFLGDLPREDAVGQVRMHSDWLNRRLGGRPKGALPAEGVWESSLPEVYHRAGLSWALVDERALTPGDPPLGLQGYYVTDTQGAALRLLPCSGSLSRLLARNPPTSFARSLARRAKAGAGAVVVSARVEHIALEVGPENFVRWLGALLTLFRKQGHWLRTDTPSARLQRLPLAGRVYPADWVPPRVARWLLSSEDAQRMLAYTERARQDAVTRAGPPLPRSGSWRRALTQHEEANRLHKRLRMASAEAARLRRGIEASPGSIDPERITALSEVRQQLYEAQSCDALWHGPEGGVCDAALRHEAWAAIARVEQRVSALLDGPERGVHFHIGDHDCDGFDEVLVRTPKLSAMVDPEAGGGLIELTVGRLPGNVLNTLTRREEPMHQALRRFSTAPALVDADDVTQPSPERSLPQIDDDSDEESLITAIPEARDEDEALYDELFVDQVPRAAFQDHFLGLPVRAEALQSGQHDERGDFWGAAYKLESCETDDAGTCSVLLTREGVVREGREERLVRVLKRYLLRPQDGGLRVQYEVINRYNEPVSGLFAVELTLNLDGRRPEACALRVAGKPPHPADLPGSWARAGQVELVDDHAGWAVTLSASTPGRVWHYPVRCVSRLGSSFTRRAQGTCLLMGWDLALWGAERAKIDLELRVDPA
ncbi:MAG: DUF1926 domain-containing protein [Alphaproteobacteria bacterium]|nr:DUF1926 domain-containing protein [Alphaproteobacteria bacterium]MCB9793879.1 DUF1926 domain-containing protein [Alphaproteobacteria bacterium]